MRFRQILNKKRIFPARQLSANLLLRVLSFLGLMAITLPLVACGISAIDVSEKGDRHFESISNERYPEALPEEEDFRGWIHSVSISPPLVNQESTLRASADWGPAGRPGISLRYQWFVNGRQISSENSARLRLSNLRSGDRIYAVAQLVLSDKKILASYRSRSTVIQNRPPQLNAELKDMREEGDDLVGVVDASDPDGDFFTIRLLEGPKGLSLSSDGRVRWPLSKVTPGEHHITIEMKDERGLGLRGKLFFSMARGLEG